MDLVMQEHLVDRGLSFTRPPALRPEVVFILGILQRSGTNYLFDLLAQHPDCVAVSGIGEDFLIANAEKLNGFVESVAHCWNASWDPAGEFQRRLRENLGEGCIELLASQATTCSEKMPRYIVSKTPSVKNLHLISTFPRCKVLVIIRDGRAVVESGMKSFSWDFELSIRQWVQGARIISAANDASVPFYLVRYEDLINDLKNQLTQVFSFLGLDDGSYSYEAAQATPVRGSSSFGRAGEVQWLPVATTAEFNPLTRWSTWSAAKLERFNWIAGPEMHNFGYELKQHHRWRAFWRCRNRILDMRRATGQALRPLRRVIGRARRLLGGARP
jgi:hypothetical protein